MRRVLVASTMLLGLTGCATIMNGTSQQMAINTSPAGASCQVSQNGTRVGTVAPTPGSLRVDKSKHDITVSCTRDGYQPGQTVASSHLGVATAGNLVLGGLTGLLVDAMTGADYDYPGEVHLELAPMVAEPAMSRPVVTGQVGS